MAASFRIVRQLAPRELVARIGACLGVRTIFLVEAAANYLYIGRWMRDRGFGDVPRFWGRRPFFDYVGSRVADEAVCYLEFGVQSGRSLRSWAERLRSPDATLHGFDSFEGLPEDWSPHLPKGSLSVGGVVPRFEDPRISVHVGWFQETLPNFEIPPHERLVVHLDADLYSSTKLALDAFADGIRPGDILMFGQIHQKHHELRAFEEFLAETKLPFRAIAATRGLEYVAFECEGGPELARVGAGLAARA